MAQITPSIAMDQVANLVSILLRHVPDDAQSVRKSCFPATNQKLKLGGTLFNLELHSFQLQEQEPHPTTVSNLPQYLSVAFHDGWRKHSQHIYLVLG